MDKPFKVKVDDNAHYGDEDERYEAGSYETLEDAVEKCKEITIASVKQCYGHGMDAVQLMAQWATFGEDPFVIGPGEKPPFSARNFVSKELCEKIVREMGG